MAKLFGFTITRAGKEPEENIPSIVPKDNDDGSIEIAPGGSSYGTYFDLEGKAKNDGELVTRYRDMSTQPECDMAIQDVINEAVIMSDDGDVVEMDLEKIEYPESLKKKIREEFNYILKLMNFNKKGYDVFKKWYVDGRLFYHLIIDEEEASAKKNGIKEIRYIDPRRIRKIREDIKERDPRTGATIYVGTKEYFMYNQQGVYNQTSVKGVPISLDSVSYTHSGLQDGRSKLIYSHLHKAIKPLNQLRMLEDSLVIYRIVRAPERRIFYIDTGNLPKGKAEQYVRDMMTKHKNKLVYDAVTGEVRNDRRFMTMLEDFWFPRREGGRGTEVTTLPGGQNLSDLEDVEYFRRKLYKSLNVPISRLETENTFNLGRSAEITRDEIKFSKFIGRLRNQFSETFNNILEIHLSLKNIVSRAEWKEIAQEISYNWQEDNHWAEMRDSEILRERISLVDSVDQYVGKYFSTKWVRKNILKQSEEDIEDMDKEMEEDGDLEDFEDEKEAQQQPPEPEQTEPEPTPVKVVPNDEPPKTQDNPDPEDDEEKEKEQEKKKEDAEKDRLKKIQQARK